MLYGGTMSFTAHVSQIQFLCQDLKAKGTLSPVEKYLCQMLEHIDINVLHFEESVSMETPFYDEFFLCLQEPHEDNYFNLLECLIVFCRERQLQGLSRQEKIFITECEQELLTFYEQSRHWHITDETLLHHWYEVELPKKYAV